MYKSFCIIYIPTCCNTLVSSGSYNQCFAVTYVLLIAAVDNTIIKYRSFTKAYISSQIVFTEITIFFFLRIQSENLYKLEVKHLNFITVLSTAAIRRTYVT